MRHQLSENAEYARDEQAWSDRDEAGQNDDVSFTPEEQAWIDAAFTAADQTASDAQIERAEACA